MSDRLVRDGFLTVQQRMFKLEQENKQLKQFIEKIAKDAKTFLELVRD